MNYDKRLQVLIERRRGEFEKKAHYLESVYDNRESFEKSSESSLLKYVIGAMEAVDKTYTQNTIDEGERIKKHLSNGLMDVEFDYQGSVTNNTHIRKYSDIDILTICNKFYSYEETNPQNEKYGKNPYNGNPIDDLVEIRQDSIKIIQRNFPEVNIDDSGSKSVSLSGGSLRRKIDMVPSNRYHTEKYQRTGEDYYMGIQVLDYHNRKRILNTPFYHNKLLEIKDKNTMGNFKKNVRFLKTIKADADEKLEISSYNITAIAYNMSDLKYLVSDNPLLLIKNTIEYLEQLLSNIDFLKSLNVPDESRKIITEEKNINEIKEMTKELKTLYIDILTELNIKKIEISDYKYSY